MQIYKTYKFRLYPTDKQQEKLNSFLGTKRFIYNHYLNEKEKNSKLTLKEMKQDLVSLQENYPWLKEVDGSILRTTLDDLDNAFTRFYKKMSGYPKYKKYTGKQSYRTPCIRGSYKEKNYQNIKIDLDRRVIKLPKIEEIKIKGYRNLKEFNKKIINATITKEAKKYYAILLVEETINLEPFIPRYVVGVDLGVKDLVITSNGLKYHKLEKLKQLENKLKGLNKWLSRSMKGSKTRQKIILKIQRVNQKIKNMRKFYNHLITNKIVKENDIIITETLKVKDMIVDGKSKLAKYISNSNLSEIIHQLKYKASWHNKRLYQINTYYPSSQTCSNCKTKNKELKDLNIREWECKSCHFKHDRDINASFNILDEGIKLYLKDLQTEQSI